MGDQEGREVTRVVSLDLEARTSRWIYELLRNWWTNTHTDIVILDEDMPDELRPA
jgi:hypothetical protein